MIPKIPFAPHHVVDTQSIITPTPDVFVGGVWAVCVLSSLPTDITMGTGIVAFVYYLICIYDNLKKKFTKPPKE